MMTKQKGNPRSVAKVKPTADRNELRRIFYEGVDHGEWNLRAALRQFRMMLGMTQTEFAKYTEVPRRVVMAIEQGKGNPTVRTLEKLLKGSGLRISVQRNPR